MKTLRPDEIVTCDICGQEFDKLYAYEVFTGRTKYICPECHNKGEHELQVKHERWRNSAKGKAAIKHYNKNK